MTLEQTRKIVSIFSLAGVKFEGAIDQVVSLWYDCLEDVEFKFALHATKRLLKKETELFANGLIAKVRIESKYLKEMYEIDKNLIEDKKNDNGRIGNGNR